MKTPEEIIKEKYPFYDENYTDKDVELDGKQVTELMIRYADQFKQVSGEPEVKVNLADMKKEFEEKFSFKNIRDTVTFDVKTLRQINEKDIWQWIEEKLKAIITL